MRPRITSLVATLSVALAATPAQASDFSGFGTFVLIIGLGLAVLGCLLGLTLAKFVPIFWQDRLACTLGKFGLFALGFGLLFLLGFKLFALSVVGGTALAAWVLVGQVRQDRDAR